MIFHTGNTQNGNQTQLNSKARYRAIANKVRRCKFSNEINPKPKILNPKP